MPDEDREHLTAVSFYLFNALRELCSLNEASDKYLHEEGKLDDDLELLSALRYFTDVQYRDWLSVLNELKLVVHRVLYQERD